MAFVLSDWSVTRSNGNVRYVGDGHGGASPSYATILEFIRGINALGDDEVAVGDDQYDITDTDVLDRSTDKIVTMQGSYNIDQTAAEHLYDGSVSQNGGDDIWAGLVVVGSVPDGTVLQIVRNNGFVDSSTAPYWGATASGVALNGDATKNILLRTCVQVRSGGSDPDGKRLRVQARELGDTYAEFSLTAEDLGNNTAAIFTQEDLNNTTAEGTIAALSIANDNEGYVGLDVNADSTNEFYYSQWDLNGDSVNDLYEYSKWLQSRDASQAAAQQDVYGLNGMLFRGITHELPIDTPTGTFQQPEPVSWSGGTGQLLAIDSTTAGTKMWIQLLTGAVPADNATITGGTSSATCLMNGSATARTVPSTIVGVSTGSALIGAYGVGVDAADLGANDKVFDLTNTQITPPNNVTFTVAGLVSGEDRVLVGPEDGAGALDVDQLALSGTLSGASVTAVVVSTTIPTDTPAAGTIRIQLDGSSYRRVAYTSYSGSTFTIPSTDFSGDNATSGNNVFISYIDKVADAASATFTAIYSSDRALFARVRDGGASPTKTFETTATLGSAGGSITAIRTADA